MNTTGRVSAFGLTLAVLFGGGWLVGRVVGPQDAGVGHQAAGVGHQAAAGGSAGTDGAAHAHAHSELAGVASALNGYLLVAESTVLQRGVAQDFRFRILDGSSAAITRFVVEHEKRLHLIVVRHDGTFYQHVHPEMAFDGTWSVPLTLPAAGAYRVFADFQPEGGDPTVLGVDVHVPGDYQPAHAGGEVRTATVDGYTVNLVGSLTGGAAAALTVSVSRNGAGVTDLQPYLGAYGHLVAVRDGDLAYQHAHPGAGKAGPEVTFVVPAPTIGRYRLFLDFQHGGVVHTASFTVDARTSGPVNDHNHGHG